jgi:hypothetical protein
MDIEAIHLAGGNRIAQALQRGAQQGITAVAVIDEAMLEPGADAILGEAGVEGSDLARDGCVADLVAGRDTGVERDTKVLHGYLSGTADEEWAKPSWRKESRACSRRGRRHGSRCS